jgi:hypothetical protein
MRPSEGAMAQTCDLIFDSDYKLGLTQYRDCSTLMTISSKQDQVSKGHSMRFGKSLDLQLDLNYQLGLLQDLLGTLPLPNCTNLPPSRLGPAPCLPTSLSQTCQGPQGIVDPRRQPDPFGFPGLLNGPCCPACHRRQHLRFH